jgi:hypothetical protein
VSERQSSGHGRRHVARRGAPRRAHASKLDLLGECEGVLDLDAEVLDGALDLGVTEQQLYCPEVARALVDLSRLGTAERMRAVAGWVKPDAGDPVLYQALILARRQVRADPDAARKYEPAAVDPAALPLQKSGFAEESIKLVAGVGFGFDRTFGKLTFVLGAVRS